MIVFKLETVSLGSLIVLSEYYEELPQSQTVVLPTHREEETQNYDSHNTI